MSKETPKATLTSVIWNWSAYYTSYISSIINASYSGENYYGGMKESLVSLTELSSLCDDQTAEKVKEAKEKIVSGDFGVFDGVLKPIREIALERKERHLMTQKLPEK